METEIPLRHWHLNDPGVVPNLLQTGAGSPTGICVYEGDAAAEGVPATRSSTATPARASCARYPVTQGRRRLQGRDRQHPRRHKKNNWFRPSDVCVAPDGSLFVADWYDPGVGGHGQRDSTRGRIFRVAPPGVKYTMPKVDLRTVDGAIAALRSPNHATRYLAWTALHDIGEEPNRP